VSLLIAVFRAEHVFVYISLMPLEGSFKLVRFDLLFKQPYGRIILFQEPSIPRFFFIEHRDSICDAI